MGGINIAGRAVVEAGLVATGMMSAPTSTGNVSVTGVGFQPTIVLFFGSFVRSDTPLIPQTIEWCVGLMTETVQRCWGFCDETFATDPVDTLRWAVDDACLRLTDSFALDWRAEFVSMDEDGFTVDFTDTNLADRIGWTALQCGVEIESVTLPPTASGTETLSLGAAPTAVLVFRDELVTDAPDANFSMGWATGTDADEQGVIAGDSEDGSTPGRNSCDLLRSGRAFAQVTSTDAGAGQWSLTDFGSTLEFTCEENGTADALVVALRGISATSGIATADTGSTTLVVPTPGVTPHGVMFLSVAKVASTSVRQAQRFCIGWGDDLLGDVGMVSGGLEDDDDGVVNTGNYLQANQELLLAYEVDTGRKGSLFQQGGGFQPDGFTVGWRRWSSAGPFVPDRAYEFLWLAFGEPG